MLGFSSFLGEVGWLGRTAGVGAGVAGFSSSFSGVARVLGLLVSRFMELPLAGRWGGLAEPEAGRGKGLALLEVKSRVVEEVVVRF